MPLEDLVRDDGFQAALVAGLIIVGFGATAALALRSSRRGALLPVAGVGIVLATIVGLDRSPIAVPGWSRLVLALCLLAAGGVVAQVTRFPLGLAVVAAVPGAIAITYAIDQFPRETDWVPGLAFVATAAGAALVADFDDEYARTGLAPGLLAVTALGMYGTLPDTEQVAALIGAAVPLALLGFPLPLAPLGRPGAFATVGLVVWVAAAGGQGRPGSVVGAIACLGVLVLEPVVRRVVAPRLARPRWLWSPRPLLVAGLHGGLALFVSLAAGREVSTRSAAAIAAAAFAVAAIGLAIVLYLDRPPTRVARATRRDR